MHVVQELDPEFKRTARSLPLHLPLAVSARHCVIMFTVAGTCASTDCWQACGKSDAHDELSVLACWCAVVECGACCTGLWLQASSTNRMKEFGERWEVDRYLSAAGYLSASVPPLLCGPAQGLPAPTLIQSSLQVQFRRQLARALLIAVTLVFMAVRLCRQRAALCRDLPQHGYEPSDVFSRPECLPGQIWHHTAAPPAGRGR